MAEFNEKFKYFNDSYQLLGKHSLKM